MTTRFANLLIDTADALAEARTGEDAWQEVQTIAGRLRANAVNVGVFLRGTGDIAWMRSSMKAEWLEEYAEDGLYQVDPLLQASLAGRAPVKYDVAAQMTGRSGDRRLRQLHGTMLGHGYRYMLTQSWHQGPQTKCLVLSCEDDPTDLFGPGTARAFSAVSAMLSISLHPPGGDIGDGWIFGSEWEPLTARETDVLSLLALGLSEGEVADRLMLSPAEMAQLMARAARKMRARTPQHALALAMTRGLLSL